MDACVTPTAPRERKLATGRAQISALGRRERRPGTRARRVASPSFCL